MALSPVNEIVVREMLALSSVSPDKGLAKLVEDGNAVSDIELFCNRGGASNGLGIGTEGSDIGSRGDYRRLDGRSAAEVHLRAAERAAERSSRVLKLTHWCCRFRSQVIGTVVKQFEKRRIASVLCAWSVCMSDAVRQPPDLCGGVGCFPKTWNTTLSSTVCMLSATWCGRSRHQFGRSRGTISLQHGRLGKRGGNKT